VSTRSRTTRRRTTTTTTTGGNARTRRRYVPVAPMRIAKTPAAVNFIVEKERVLRD